MLRYAVACVLLGVLVTQVDISGSLKIVSSASLPLLLLCWLGMLSVYFTKSLALRMVMSVHGTVPMSHLFAWGLVGAFFSNFLPSQAGGDLVKGVYLGRYIGSVREAYAAMLVQRGLTALASLLMAMGAVSTLVPPGRLGLDADAGRVWAAGLAAAAVMLAGLVLGRRRLMPALLAFPLTRSVAGKGVAFVRSVLAYRHRPGLMTAVFAFSFFIFFQGVLVTWLAALTVGGTIPFATIFLASSISQLSALIPISPGGIGVGESIFTASCSLMGARPEEALAVALIMRLVLVTSSLTGGLIYLAWAPPARDQ